ncbi:SWI/SNF chromatin-remodeling complex subunit, partial [Serendipita sp. 399]
RELIYVDDNEGEPDSKVNEDLRILIKLDISYGIRRLEDQFEWDISDKRNSPERFAECYCMDLGLSGEFETAIAHSIREQVQTYEKSLFLVGHPMDGSTIQDEDLRLAFLPSLNTCIRPADQVAAHTPQLNYFNEIELEKTFDRGGNRKRRQPRGRRAGAIPLPDRDPIKTFRTPTIGFPEVEKEKETWVPSRRQAAVVAERANAQIAVIESEPDLKPAPPIMGTIQPSSQMQGNRQSSTSGGANSASQKAPEIPKRDRQELLRGPPVSKRVLRSRPVPPSTALNPDAPVPDYLRGFDDKNKGAEKKKNLYKDRELPEGLHPNIIDGVWHCSSCGCPEEIAIGRRQGPLGPKTMCGDCGKWWHRHRKPMDIIYRTDKEYHIERKKKEEEYRRLKKKGGMKAAQAAAAALVDGRAAAAAAAQKQQTNSTYSAPLFTTVPRPLNNTAKAQPSPLKPVTAHSPDSSLSPPPFTPQTSKPSFDKVSLDPPKVVVQQPTTQQHVLIPRAPSMMVNGTDGEVGKPEWLVNDMARLRTKYPDSAFYVIRKQPEEGVNPEWRVKCSDCPQKLYKPGPGESLENFEVHLKNRQHLLRIAQRKGLAPPTPSASNTSPPQAGLSTTPMPTPASTQLTPGIAAVSISLAPNGNQPTISDSTMQGPPNSSAPSFQLPIPAAPSSPTPSPAIATPAPATLVKETSPTPTPMVVDTSPTPTPIPAPIPISLPDVEPTAEPTTEPTTESTTEPTTELTTEPPTEPLTEPITEPTTESTTEPTTEPTAEPIIEPTAEPNVEPTVALSTEPITELPIIEIDGNDNDTFPVDITPTPIDVENK